MAKGQQMHGEPLEPHPQPKAETIDNETSEIVAEAEDMYEPSGEDTTQIISKITVSECAGNPAAAKALQQRIPVLAVYGKVTGVKTVDDPTSQKTFVAMTGAFNAINLQTNQQYASGTLFLPDAFQSMLITELEALAEKGIKRGMKAFGGIEFSYQIDAKPSANPSGYSYVLRSLMPPKKADPLAHLRVRTLALLAPPERVEPILVKGPNA